MISTRNDDDEPDVIDLTISYGYHGSMHFPLRPPTPFADDSMWSQQHVDDDSNGVLTWSSPTKQLSFDYNKNNTVSSHSQASPRANSTWRRTLDRILKRAKSNDRKKIVSPTTSDITHPYDFGVGEISRTDSITLRSSGKRVHWIDDDELILNACHRFVEYFKLFVQNIIHENDDNHLKTCQKALDDLNSLIDCQKINEAFEYSMELVEKQDKRQLFEQQTIMENLISRTVLFSSA